MATTASFKKTLKQAEAVKLLASSAKHIMLYGGSRSGKSFIAVYAVIVRACKEKSRHVILRLKFNHAKTSIWHETLPTVLNICFPNLTYKMNNTDYFIQLPNGSEVWVAGLDDKIRTEKILGKEYSTIFFNECSQIPRASINIALTRLAQKNNLAKKAYYDENPPSKKHWSYWYFIKGVHPESSEMLDAGKYASILMNPTDNLENIDEDYIDGVLGELAEKDRSRFLKGEFTDADEGQIYYAFQRDAHVKEFDYLPAIQKWAGFDFNNSPMTAVIGWIVNDTLYIWDEIYQESKEVPKRFTATEYAGLRLIKKYGQGINAVPDSTGKKSTSNATRSDIQILKDIGFSLKTIKNPFRVDRYSVANSAFSKGKVVIHPRCKYTIKDFENVFYKEGSDLPDTSDKNLTHISDAATYLIYRTINPLKGKFKITQQVK